MRFEQHMMQGNTQGENGNRKARQIPVPGSADEVQDDTRCMPSPENVCRLSRLLCQATLYSIL
jgi:hypothetical protein